MSSTFSAEDAAKILGKNLLQNVEDAFYEELRPKLDQIARRCAKNLARSLQGYIYHEYSQIHGPRVMLKFNDEELKFD